MKGIQKTSFVLLLAAGLVSCGGGSSSSASSTPASSSQASTSSSQGTSSAISSKEESSSASEIISESSEVSSSEESSSETSSSHTKKSWDDDGVLKILEIGNSYGEDTFQHAPEILKALGVEHFVLGKMYVGGSSIDDHHYFSTVDTRTRGSYEYRKIDETSLPNWSLTEQTSALYAINDEEWDFISVQQQSMQSTDPAKYGHFGDWLDFIEANNKYEDTKLVYNMTWAYPENNMDEKYVNTYHSNPVEMYEDIVSTCQTVVATEDRIEKILVPGTAAENARTSYLKKKLFRDDLHLSYDIGRYIAGLTYFTELIDGELTDEFTYTPASLNEAERTVALEAAMNALSYPFEITESLYPTDPTSPYDGVDHTVRLEAEDGVLDGLKVKVVGCENASGGYIAADMNDCGQGVEWVYYAPVGGVHQIEIAYWTAFAGSKDAIFVNGEYAGDIVYTQADTWANGFNDSLKVQSSITLQQGYNTISLAKHGFGSDSPEYGGWVQLDYMDIIGTNAVYDVESLNFAVDEFTLQAEYGNFHTGGLPFYCDKMEGFYAVGEINSTGHGVDLTFRVPVTGKYGLKVTYAQGNGGNAATVIFNNETANWELPTYAGQAWDKNNRSEIILEANCSEDADTFVSISRAATSAAWFIIDSITLVAIVD